MPDITLTSGDDTYTQPTSARDVWNDYHALAGNDVLRVYAGTVLGGAGDDRIERLPSDDWWRDLNAAYWDSPDGVVVDLAQGWAQDGFGGRDTLVGVDNVSASNHDDRVTGNAEDNRLWGGGGHDTFNGAAGTDWVNTSWFEPAPGEPWRPPLLSELSVQVSVDGRSATLKPAFGHGFEYTLTDVEEFEVWTGRDAEGNNLYTNHAFGDFIRPADMAEQAVASGGDLRWNAAQALGSPVSLSFSFVAQAPASGVGKAGFRAFTAAEQQVVRSLLADTAALAGISFTEVSESGGAVGQLRFGVSQQAGTRGVSWQPNAPGAGDLAGDIWMDVESMLGLTPGSEGYAALLHEIGHALGLRHPRNADAGDDYAVQLREGDDRTSLSVMSQIASSDGLFRADWGLLDVQALRYLYGERAVNAGDNHYLLSTPEAAAQTTLVDDGGIDMLDASAAVAGVSLDLAEAHLSSVGISPAGISGVDNFGIAIGSLIEQAIGSAYDDVLLGNALDNWLTGGLGNDWLEGGEGSDTAVFTGKRADYQVTTGFGKVFVEGRDGVAGFDTLIGIERLAFADGSVALADSALGADQDYTLDEDGALSAMLPDPSDLDRSAVSYRLAGGAAHGTATVSAGGVLSYTPQADFHGLDTVAFEIVGAEGSNRYLAFVSVLPVNDAGPIAREGAYLVQSSSLMQSQLPAASDIDGDALSYSLGSAAAHGEVVIAANGEFSYRPVAGFLGTDHFSYLVSDGMGGSASQTVTLEVVAVGSRIAGTAGTDVLAAAAGNDGYSAGAGDDRISGGAGNDVIDGGSGLDTAVFAGRREDFAISRASTHWGTADTNLGDGNEGSDRLVAVERLAFADGQLALDLDGAAGHTVQIIRALFGPQYLDNEAFVGIGIALFDGGASYASVVELAVSAVPAFAGGASNEAFIRHVYRNVIGVAPGADELAYFNSLFDAGIFTQASLGLLACQIDINVNSVELIGLATTGIEFMPPA